MGFKKREIPDNYVSIGDKEGDKLQAGGIFTRMIENTHFKNPKLDYEYVNKKGELVILSGSASLARQIEYNDMGKFFKVEFEGWGDSPNGKFKKVGVYIWEGDVTPEMKQWPRYAEFYNGGFAKKEGGAHKKDDAVPVGGNDLPEALENDEDDLPF